MTQAVDAEGVTRGAPCRATQLVDVQALTPIFDQSLRALSRKKLSQKKKKSLPFGKPFVRCLD